MNQAWMKILFLIAMVGMFAYFTLLKDFWVQTYKKTGLDFGSFFAQYGGLALGGAAMYMILPAIVLVFPGRSFERYVATVFIVSPIMYYFTVPGSII